MARRAAIDLMLNDVNQGDSNRWVDWQGGAGLLLAEAIFGGGNIKLEIQSRNGTALGLNHDCTTTPISITVNGTAYFRSPAGKIRITVTTATAVYAAVVGIPANEAG